MYFTVKSQAYQTEHICLDIFFRPDKEIRKPYNICIFCIYVRIFCWFISHVLSQMNLEKVKKMCFGFPNPN